MIDSSPFYLVHFLTSLSTNKFVLKLRTSFFTPSNPYEWKSFSRAEKKRIHSKSQERSGTPFFKANATCRALGTIYRRGRGGTGKFFIISTQFDKNISDWSHDCTDHNNDNDFFMRLDKWLKIDVKKCQNLIFIVENPTNLSKINFCWKISI